MNRRVRLTGRSALLGVVIVCGVLGWRAWERRQAEQQARAAVLQVCTAAGVSEGECTQSVEANSAACFDRTYTPSKSGGRGSSRIPARFDAAAYQSCVLGPARTGR